LVVGQQRRKHGSKDIRVLPNVSLASSIADSTVAQQLRAGFRWLRFADPLLELSFRQHHTERSHTGVQLHLWLAVALVMAFVMIDEYVLNRVASTQLLVVRLIALCSLMASVLLTARRHWYARYYPSAIQVLVPLFGISAVVNELIDQPQGVSFFAAIVLVVFAVYLLVGLLCVSALATGLFILAVYVFGAVAVGVPPKELIYNGAILLFSNVLGATASYTLERLLRVNFLEARLLSDAANRDGLTGIYNRRAFDDHTERVWQQAVREQKLVSLMLVDIDHFKAYNDFYGHQAGDQCLQQVARILTLACRRPLDFTARYGGEEFAVVLYDADPDYLKDLAGRIHQQLLDMGIAHPASSGPHRLTVSIGAAFVQPDHDRSVFGFVQLADEALYEAKDAGRDRTVIKDKEHADLSTGEFRVPNGQARRRVS
jgi:diguanylate cyclase (GGDEF)-like protein